MSSSRENRKGVEVPVTSAVLYSRIESRGNADYQPHPGRQSASHSKAVPITTCRTP